MRISVIKFKDKFEFICTICTKSRIGTGEALHDALYRGYFADRRNVGDVDELLVIVEAVGLSAKAAHGVLENRSFKDAVDADWTKSHRYGVTGVPTFIAGGRGVVGAQPYEAIADLLTQSGATAI